MPCGYCVMRTCNGLLREYPGALLRRAGHSQPRSASGKWGRLLVRTYGCFLSLTSSQSLDTADQYPREYLTDCTHYTPWGMRIVKRHRSSPPARIACETQKRGATASLAAAPRRAHHFTCFALQPRLSSCIDVHDSETNLDRVKATICASFSKGCVCSVASFYGSRFGVHAYRSLDSRAIGCVVLPTDQRPFVLPRPNKLSPGIDHSRDRAVNPKDRGHSWYSAECSLKFDRHGLFRQLGH